MATPRQTSDIFSNPHFVEFRKKLEEHGRHLEILWSCKSGCIDADGKKFRYDDVFCFALYGGKVRSSTIIVKDYGIGFGLYTEPEGNHTYLADVCDIIGFEGLHDKPITKEELEHFYPSEPIGIEPVEQKAVVVSDEAAGLLDRYAPICNKL